MTTVSVHICDGSQKVTVIVCDTCSTGKYSYQHRLCCSPKQIPAILHGTVPAVIAHCQNVELYIYPIRIHIRQCATSNKMPAKPYRQSWVQPSPNKDACTILHRLPCARSRNSDFHHSTPQRRSSSSSLVRLMHWHFYLFRTFQLLWYICVITPEKVKNNCYPTSTGSMLQEAIDVLD